MPALAVMALLAMLFPKDAAVLVEVVYLLWWRVALLLLVAVLPELLALHFRRMEVVRRACRTPVRR